MTDSLKDTRLSSATSLHGDIESLLKVDPANRQNFVHDRLMSAIDAICDEHKSGQSAIFNQKQMLVLKDVAYHIVYLLDPLNKAQKGFFHSLRSQFVSAKPVTQIGWVVATLVFLSSILGGAYQNATNLVQYVKSFHIVQTDSPTSDSSQKTPK